MKKFIQLLQSLHVQDSLFASHHSKIAVLLSGQSDFEHSELSREQKELLALLAQYGYSGIDAGFPFNKSHDHSGCRRAGMITASYRNMIQFVHAALHDRYKQLIAKHLQPLFESKRELVMICQSSGLHMLQMALPYMTVHRDLQATIIALGPVTMKRFHDHRFHLVVVKGYQDRFSQWLNRDPVDYWVPCNHFDYCQSKEVLDIVGGILKSENQNRLHCSSL